MGVAAAVAGEADVAGLMVEMVGVVDEGVVVAGLRSVVEVFVVLETVVADGLDDVAEAVTMVGCDKVETVATADGFATVELVLMTLGTLAVTAGLLVVVTGVVVLEAAAAGLTGVAVDLRAEAATAGCDAGADDATPTCMAFFMPHSRHVSGLNA